MSTRAPIEQLLESGIRLYSILSQRFTENDLVRQIWSDLAHDLQLQVQAVRSLDAEFWNHLKFPEATAVEIGRLRNRPETFESMSFHDCLSLSLDLEEFMILNLFSLVIRPLRSRETNGNLDFYIIVKAHVARLMHIVKSFSGDPLLTRRALALMEGFENKVQAPAEPLRQAKAIKPAASMRSARSRKKQLAAPMSSSATSMKTRPGDKRSRSVSDRIKPLVKKIKMPRRQAHR
jgi:hypothetical protein